MTKYIHYIIAACIILSAAITSCKKDEKVKEFTVVFNSNGGSEVSNQTVKDGEKASKPTDPTKAGNTFGGWFKDNNTFAQEWNFAANTVTANTTLYAKWNAVPLAPVITITAHPAPMTTVTEGAVSGNLTVAATATQGATPTYQWYGNTVNSNTGGTSISGATSASFTIPADLTAAGSPYYYFCEVSTAGAESKSSDVARVTVNAAPRLITIDVQPAATLTVTEGDISASISVSASVTGGGSVTYRWHSNNAPTNEDGSAIAGATNATFQIPATLTAAGSPYYYFCEVSATGADPKRSDVTNVTVEPNTLLETDKAWYDANPAAATFSIGAAAELAYLAQLVNGGVTFSGKTVNLTADIDLNVLTGDWIIIGTSNSNSFRGTFDGKGKTVSNLVIGGSGIYKGLFGVVWSSGTVKNVRLAGVSISTDGGAIGGVAGFNQGTIENCSVAGAISGSNSGGGIVGTNYGTVRNCRSAANVTISGGDSGGGIVGNNYTNGKVEYCYATGSVSATGDGHYFGGIAGYYQSSSSVVQHCVALNSSVATANIYTSDIGRVFGVSYGGSTLTNNHADNGMPVTGAGYTAETGNGNKDGASITATEYHSAAWWRDTAGFSETVWMLANGALPTLK